jgi:broad specificity phosphatase PhoE
MAAMIYLIRHLRPAGAGVMWCGLDPALESEVHTAPLIEVAGIYCSPLQRARRTAELYFPGREIEVLPELAEISMGEWNGLTWQEIEARWPEKAREKLRNWPQVTPPGGEAWSEFAARVERAWQVLRQAPQPCAVVAHSAVNAVLAHLATGRDPLAFVQNYGEVVTLEIL